MYKTPSFQEVNFIPALSARSLELRSRAYCIASRRTLVLGVVDKIASKSDFNGASGESITYTVCSCISSCLRISIMRQSSLEAWTNGSSKSLDLHDVLYNLKFSYV